MGRRVESLARRQHRVLMLAASLAITAVKFAMRGSKLRIRHVRVDLCGVEVCVPQQLLDRPQIRAVGEQVGGERMSQGVGRRLDTEPGSAHVLLYGALDRPR